MLPPSNVGLDVRIDVSSDINDNEVGGRIGAASGVKVFEKPL